MNDGTAILRVPTDAEERKVEICHRMEDLGWELRDERAGEYPSGMPCIELRFRRLIGGGRGWMGGDHGGGARHEVRR